MSQDNNPQTSQDELTEDSLENVAGGQLQWEATNPVARIRTPGLPGDGTRPLPGGTGPMFPQPIQMPDAQ